MSIIAQRRQYGTRQGLTLVELLIAMVVLLVGIYTVAAGFPRLLHAIRGEGERTIMARLAEQALSRLSENPYGLPDAITGGGSVAPKSVPEDLTAPHIAPTALLDITEVRGEKFRVPAPYNPPGTTGGTGYGYYVLAQGPAECPDWATGYPYVYMLVPLAERQEDPRTSEAIVQAGNWFYADRSGEIIVPATVTTKDGTETTSWNVSNIVVDYAWTAPPQGEAEPLVHYVHQETPSDVEPITLTGGQNGLAIRVHPAHLPGGIQLVPGRTRVWARVDFTREEFGDAYPDAPGRYVLDNNFGLTLCFHPADAGLTLYVDYRLRTHQTQEDLDAAASGETVRPRRLLLMAEDIPIESRKTREDNNGVPFGEVRLALKNIDSEPLFTTDLSGAALPSPVHVLAVDLQTGQIYTDGAGFALQDENLSPPLRDGYQQGMVTFPLEISGQRAEYVGHTLRFFYRTQNLHTLQIQKAPRYYVDAETAQSYLGDYLPSGQNEAASLAEVDFRTYRFTMQPSPNDANWELGVLEFGQWLSGGTWATAESSSGETIAVSYSYVSASGKREYVWGELHTIPEGGRKVTLHHASRAGQPIHILAVNGVSARVKAYWLNRTGRVQTFDIETLFLANALGPLPRVQ